MSSHLETVTNANGKIIERVVDRIKFLAETQYIDHWTPIDTQVQRNVELVFEAKLTTYIYTKWAIIIFIPEATISITCPHLVRGKN